MSENGAGKILAVSHEFPPIGGGGANACYYLTKGFAEKGYEVTLVTANFQGLPDDEIQNGVRIIRVYSKRSHMEHCSFSEMMSFLLKAKPVVKGLAQKEHFDLCLVFFGIPSGALGYYLKKKYHIPYIIRFGGGDIPGFQERFKKVYQLLAPMIRKIWREADARIANSDGLRQMALDFCDKYPFQVIPNGVDTERFTPGVKKDKDYLEILFVSRLIERKGLQFVIPELRSIQEGTDKKIKLVVVGDGPYRPELERIATEHQVSDMISFEGQKSKDEIIPYYQNADIFILPSKKEGMPNVVLEAVSCGLSIVMTPCQGAKELIDGNGYVSEIPSFAVKVKELVQNDDLRMQMGNRSRELAEKHFGWKFTIASYLRLIEVERRKLHKDNEIHRDYELQEFIFDDVIKEKAEELLLKYRSTFTAKKDSEYTVNDLEMIFSWIPLFEELKYYYNNDVCVSCAICLSVMENCKYNLRTYAYYYENAVHRIEASWEYAHILMNDILGLELAVGKDIQEKNIMFRSGTWEFVESENGFKPKFHLHKGEKLKEVREEAKRENVLLNLSLNKKKSVFHKLLNRKMSINDRVSKINELYFSDEASELHRIRNEFVHRRSLGAKFSVGPSLVGPGQSICIDPNGWFDFKGKKDLLEKNISIIREVIQTIQDIIYNHDVPNTKEYENEVFFCTISKCPSCDRVVEVPKELFEFFIDRSLNVPCSCCWKKGLIKIEDIIVDNRHYFQLLLRWGEEIGKHADIVFDTEN